MMSESTPQASPTYILAENLLSDEEHESLDVSTVAVMLTNSFLPELARPLILIHHILAQAPPKANLRTISSEEIQRILIDERVFNIVQEAAQLRTFRNVRNLGKSLSCGKCFNCIRSPI